MAKSLVEFPSAESADLAVFGFLRGKAEDAQKPAEVYDFEQEPLIEFSGELKPMHEGQRAAWHSVFRYVAVFAGWRSGKTSCGPWWLLREMQRKGPGDYAIVTPDYPRLFDKALPEMKKVMRRTIGADGFSTSGNIIRITPAGQKKLWGYVSDVEVRILLRHAERADAIEAFDGLGIWVDEPGFIDDSEVWEAIRARVSIGRHRIILTGRPDRFNWYVKEIWNRVMDKLHRRRPDADPEVDVINFRSVDNPAFDEEEYLHNKARMKEWRFLMKFDGIPTKSAGVIYDTYKTIPRFPVRPEWQRASGHDFGKLNTCGVWAFKHPTWTNKEGRPQWVIYSVYLKGNRTADEHILSWLYGEEPTDDPTKLKDRPPEKWRVGRKRNDEGKWAPVVPWACGGNTTTEDDSRALYAGKGYPIAAPHVSRVFEGIDIMYAMLKTEELLIFDDLKMFVNDLDSYSNEISDEGEPDQEKIQDKAKYHRMDAARGLCIGLTAGGDPVIVNPNGDTKGDGKPEESKDDIRRMGIATSKQPSGDIPGANTARGRYMASGKRAKTGAVRSSVRSAP